MKERKVARAWWWLLVLVLVAMAPGFLGRACPRGSADGRPLRFTANEGTCSFYVGERRYLARDKDDDGRVDCFFRVPVGFPGTRYRAADFEGRCTRSFTAAKPMAEAMRAALNRILELRFEQGAWSDHADDVDADSVVDCVRDSPGEGVLVTFEGGRCEAGDEWTETGDAEQQEVWNEILRHENQVRAAVAESAG